MSVMVLVVLPVQVPKHRFGAVQEMAVLSEVEKGKRDENEG